MRDCYSFCLLGVVFSLETIILPMRDCYFPVRSINFHCTFYYLTYEGLLHECMKEQLSLRASYYLTYEGLLPTLVIMMLYLFSKLLS